ncbi:MAG: hypothetical protein GEU96_19685 [Propionibacteriales bacterium]|nr:hypothetical protein [Propionibacteriales bacterium]
MHGLTVRWSLDGTDDDVLQQLREYVRDTSHARFTDLKGLRFKTWRARAGEWFEGCYVFETPAARDGFQASFEEKAATSPGSQLVGSSPVLIEPCEIIAIAEGAAGFTSAPAYS